MDKNDNDYDVDHDTNNIKIFVQILGLEIKFNLILFKET